jgi:predicted DNA-binding transcriptional regulator YafY
MSRQDLERMRQANRDFERAVADEDTDAALEDDDSRFERPDDFDLGTYWAQQVTEFRTRLVQGDALIRLSPAGRRRLEETMAADVVKAVNTTAEDDCELPGWVKATVPIESLTHAHGQFLALGAGVEVLAPAELRERIAETAAGLARMYGGGG